VVPGIRPSVPGKAGVVPMTSARAILAAPLRVAAVLVVLWVGRSLPGAAAEKPDRDRLYDEAHAYLSGPDRKQKEAIDKFMAVIAADPSHWDNDMVLLAVADLLRNGDSYHGTCDPASALDVCQAVIDKFPPTREAVTKAQITMGDIYLSYGQCQAAQAAYERVVHTDTSGPEWDGIREKVKMYADGLAVVLNAATSGEGVAVAIPAPSADFASALKVIAEIPSRKDAKAPASSDIVRARILDTTLDDLVQAVHGQLGVGVSVEFMPGEQRRVSLSADYLSAASLLDLYAARYGALETVKNDAGAFSLLWKDSPFRQASKSEYSVTDCPRVKALEIICDGIQKSLGPGFHVFFGGFAGNLPETIFSDKVSLSVSGTPYEALDAWAAAAGPGFLWAVRWRDARTAVVELARVIVTRSENPSLSIGGKP
jgi:hypothetical protein